MFNNDVILVAMVLLIRGIGVVLFRREVAFGIIVVAMVAACSKFSSKRIPERENDNEKIITWKQNIILRVNLNKVILNL